LDFLEVLVIFEVDGFWEEECLNHEVCLEFGLEW
jgi:hypothetical protein